MEIRFPLARVRQIRKGPPVGVESRLSVCQTSEKGESFDEEFHGNISNVIICVAHPYAVHARASDKIFRKKIVVARPRTRRNSRPRQRRFLSYDAVQIIWHAPSGIRFTMFPEPRLVFPSRRCTKRTCSCTPTPLCSPRVTVLSSFIFLFYTFPSTIGTRRAFNRALIVASLEFSPSMLCAMNMLYFFRINWTRSFRRIFLIFQPLLPTSLA